MDNRNSPYTRLGVFVQTSFKKVRVILAKDQPLRIDCCDFRFADSKGRLLIVGAGGTEFSIYDVTAYACAHNVGGQWSDATINLTQTPFKFATTWQQFGWQGQAQIDQKSPQHTNIKGKGTQGGCCPKDMIPYKCGNGTARFNWQNEDKKVYLAIDFLDV